MESTDVDNIQESWKIAKSAAKLRLYDDLKREIYNNNNTIEFFLVRYITIIMALHW